MGNIRTCIDSTRSRSAKDDKILEGRFAALDEAKKHIVDPATGKFRTMAEAMEIAKNNIKD